MVWNELIVRILGDAWKLSTKIIDDLRKRRFPDLLRRGPSTWVTKPSLRAVQDEFAITNNGSAPFQYVYSPSPIADFNAAGLFYFTEYQSLIERVEWLRYRDVLLLRPKTLERQIAYFGSPNLGEDLRVELFPVQSWPGELRHIVRVSEAVSHRLLARPYTTKKVAAD